MPAEVDPELALQLAREAQRVYSDATAEMLEQVSKRLAKGIREPGWAELKLADVTRLRKAQTEILDRAKTRSTTAITNALTEAYASGLGDDNLELGGGFGRNSGRSLNNLLKETLGTVHGTHGAILRSTEDRYRAIIADTTTRVAIGIDTRQGATSKALSQFARSGITGFRDRAGRQWEIETYAEMATRTASGRAAVAGSLDRMAERGIGLVIVSNAPEECKTCRPWEGKVLSIDGDSSEYPSVDEARSQGLLHSNCRHSLSAYVPGLTRAPTNTADPEGDKLRQRQRALERQVRAAKRQVASQKAFVDTLKAEGTPVDPAALTRLQQAQATQRAATDRLTEFVDENDRKRLRYREQPRGGPSAPPKAIGKPKRPKSQPGAWKETMALDWGKLPAKIVDRYEKAFDKIAADYPAVVSRLDWMGDWTAQLARMGRRNRNVPRAMAVTMRVGRESNSTVGIGFMRGHHASLSKIERTVKANADAGFLAVGDMEGVMVHEVGHVAVHALQDAKHLRFVNKIDDAMRAEFAPGLDEKAWRISTQRYDAMRSVSKYAATSNDEFWAESFASYRLAENPPKAARIVGGIMDELLRSLE